MAAPVSAARKSPLQPAPAASEPTPRVPPFSAIYRDYFDFVWSSARRQGVGLGVIDDLVQEVFIVIHARIGTLEHPESLRSWIYGIVRRTVSTHHRSRRARAGATTPPFEVRAWQPTPLDAAEHRDEVRLLSTLLETLDSPKREVFVLAELEELTAPEIAGVLGIPLNTAYSRLRAARQAFDQALARHNAQRGGRPCRT
ncbi:MAG: sigma-70 family RNA polymerase sigma factor [Polyangiaceae bacterium]|nr:sigma-70 family RNA polymerase sigma factor [Polyangiaceae bacterium]